MNPPQATTLSESPPAPPTSVSRARPRPRGSGPGSFRKLIAPLASLRLTVFLIVLSIILIYAGTWAQLDTGIWKVQKEYFHSLFVWIPFATFLPRPQPGHFRLPGGFPMLGGYSLGLLLLINLIAAHALRFKARWWDLLLIPAIAATYAIGMAVPPSSFYTLVATLAISPLPILLVVAPLHRKRTGVILIHLGLIMLLVGEGVTSTLAVESQMPIDIGQTVSYSQDSRTTELAIIDTSPQGHDDVAAIPASMLKTGATIHHSALPVDVHIDAYYLNSEILGPMQAGGAKDARATDGLGVGLTLLDAPPIAATDSNDSDWAGAYVTLSAHGRKLGTWLLSDMPLQLPGRGLLDQAQPFKLDGKTYRIQLRFKRIYHPFTMTLLDFRHKVYLGTDIARDFSSHVRLVDPTRHVDREVRIWMNNPLRYHGLTFYQEAFKQGDTGTVLQIVHNPAWLMPYFACAIGALGLLIHFSIVLIRFISRNLGGRSETEATEPWFSTLTTVMVGVVLLIYGCVLFAILKPAEASRYDFEAFSTLPVSHGGRIQPLDSLARNTLKILSGRESARIKGKSLPAIRWLADMFGRPEKADNYPVILIDNPDLVGLLGLEPRQRRYSYNEIMKSRDKLEEQFDRANQVADKDRDLFQKSVVELGEKLTAYIQTEQMESLYLVPPLNATEKWQPLSSVLSAKLTNPVAQSYSDLVNAYHDQKPEEFNRIVHQYAATVEARLPVAEQRVEFEALFNRFDPFLQCMILYVLGFVLACLSWLFLGTPLRRAALVALGLALLLHTGGLVARIYISGRPPVTNLASSAIFIAWATVILSLGLEFFYRNGIGAACASMLGFLSLLIADRLSLSGDTMEVLRAVLDTNFWLATHVVVITLGYSATFLAGFIGIIWVIGHLFGMERDQSRELTRMIYGITCFAILFSFVGTVLGGIWADQSWGRFWGWDPKENGAVLIVLANALLLHARWAGLAKDRGIACLAIFGNIVTAWSWFGVNMLGVGLHSYGFMQSALLWLLAFVVSQVALIALANLSLAPATPPATQ